MSEAPPVGRRWPPQTYEVGREKIREYADAVGASSPVHRDHEAARSAGFSAVAAPPLFAAVYVAPAVASVIFDPAVGVFDPKVGLAGYRFVQRAQSFEWGEPVCSGDTVTTVAGLIDAEQQEGGDLRVFESVSTNQEGSEVVRARYEGIVPAERRGGSRRKPDVEPLSGPQWSGTGTEIGPGQLLPPLRVTPDRYTGCRYAGASGDFTPFHLDDDFARSLGMPGMILHGLYTLAQLARGLTEPFGGDPRTLRRLAARLRGPAFPERELEVRARVESAADGELTLACEVLQEGRRVLSDGEATVEHPSPQK